MITLNLIPPEKKKSLRVTSILLIIKHNLIMLFFVIAFSAFVLLLGKAAIDEHFTNVVSQSTLTTKYARIFNYEIKDFNNKVDAAVEIQNKNIPWVIFFSDLAKQIPDGIKITYLEIKDGNIAINGNAKTRNDLIQFKKNLENFKILTNVTIPLESMLKKENIDFNVKAKYENVKLKNYEQ